MARITGEYRSFLESELPRYARALADTLEDTEPSVAVRVNPLKGGEECGVVSAGESVPWCGEGFYLSVRPEFIFDPAMHQGRYYVQDVSSMFVGHVVTQLSAILMRERPARPLRYLDACAAPGGKTSAAIGALPVGSLVVANEYDFRRAEILKENVVKWGYPDVVVSRGDTSRFRSLPVFFDVVAADVPCSGEGMMRKDDTACRQWSRGLVEECAMRQKEIVANLWRTLRPGGFMIYSTCTFNRRENEDVMEWLVGDLGAEKVAVDFASDWGVVDTGLMLRFLPSELRGEGLAIGVVRKPLEGFIEGDSAGEEPRSWKRVPLKNNLRRDGKEKSGGRGGGFDAASLRKICGDWINSHVDFEFVMNGDEAVAVHNCHSEELRILQSALDVIYPGVAVGAVKGREIVPSHALAMSVLLNRKAFPCVEVDYEAALAYLRRDAMQGVEAPKGFVLLCYDGFPLGFVNHLGNRSNNLYPASWRILRR